MGKFKVGMEKLDDKNLRFKVNFSDKEELQFETLYKSNAIIFGKIVNPQQKLYTLDYKVLNFLYTVLQNIIRNREKPQGAITVRIPLKIYRYVVDNQSNWKKYFAQSVFRLDSIKFKLTNYYNEDTKQRIKEQSTQLIALPKFFDKDYIQTQDVIQYDKKNDKINFKIGGVEFLEVVFPYDIAISCWQKTRGYTHIDLKTINKFKNKFSIKFYEALLSKIQYNLNNSMFDNEITLMASELSGILDKELLKDTSINLKNFLHNIIHFDDENGALDELKKILPIKDYMVSQSEMFIKFIFDEEGYMKFISSKLTPYKLEVAKLNNMLKVKETNNNYVTDDGIEVVEEVFDLDPLQPEKAVVDFIEILKNNFCNVELLKTDKEKEEYGNIVIIKDKGFCDKNNFFKPISRYKENKLVYYLYKNYYSDFMLKIQKEQKEELKKVELNKVNSIFEPFINKNVILSENEIGIIKNIEQINDGIEVMFDVCNRDDEYKIATSMIIKNFDDILALANYIMQNEIKDNICY